MLKCLGKLQSPFLRKLIICLYTLQFGHRSFDLHNNLVFENLFPSVSAQHGGTTEVTVS